MLRTIIVCPIKNEAWILHRFLSIAFHIADHIIIADQGSTDGSREICSQYDKVKLIENPCRNFDEAFRQNLLLEEARRIEPPRLILALDADEVLSANTLESPEWETVRSCNPGTTILIPWVNLWGTPAWFKPASACEMGPWAFVGYMDDDAPHTGRMIHSTRVPYSPLKPVLKLNDVVLLHYQYTSWKRMRSKHRWYRCLERLRTPRQSATSIHRVYAHMESPLTCPLQRSHEKWFSGWEAKGIDMTSIQEDEYFWWDWEVLRMFEQYGERTFAQEDIWYVDWEEVRQAGLQLGIENLPTRPIVDPRTVQDKLLLKIRRHTQGRRGQRWVDFILQKAGR
jgi:glycosyltransferase involved in cell wall biosynthesis